MLSPNSSLVVAEIQSAIVRSPLTVSLDTPVTTAIACMNGADSQGSALPTADLQVALHRGVRSSCVVVLAADGKVAGILTERDVVRLCAQPQTLELWCVGQVMTRSVITLRESEVSDVLTPMRLFQQYQIRHLPIVDQADRLVGLITYESLHWESIQRTLEQQRDFNHLIAEISSRFADLEPTNLNPEIDRTLQLLGEATQADTSYLFHFTPAAGSPSSLADRTMSLTYEWCQQGYPRQMALVQGIPLTAFPWANTRLLEKEVVHVPDVGLVPPEAAIDQTSWQRFNLVSVLTVPLIQQSVVVGGMGFASFSRPLTWSDETVRLLKMVAQTIANVQTRIQVEQNLVVSEERLRLALSATNQGLYDLNLQTGVAVVNREYALMLGYDPATFEETNSHWLKRLHPDDQAGVARAYEAYVKGEISEYRLEFRQRTQNGDYKWILSLGKIVAWDEAGQPLRMLGTHTDISDRKRVEEQSQYRLDILEAARDMIASADRQGHLTYLNQAGRAMLAIDPGADISQSRVADYHPPEIARLLLEKAIPHAVQHGFWQGETLFRRRDGQDFPVWQIIVAHYLQDGRVSQFSTIARDITDRKQVEAERLQGEQTRRELKLLEQIFEIVLAGYWDWEIPYQQEYLSPGFKRMFGYEDDELPNTPETWQRLIFPEDLPRVLETYDRHVQSRGQVPYYNEVRYRHKDGSTVWVICSGQVIEWDRAGQPLRMIGCHIDITKLKQVEAQLQEAKEELEHFFTVALDLLCIADVDGYFRRLNLAWENTLGYTLADLEGQQFLDFVHPDDREATLAAIASLNEQVVVSAFVNRYRCKDGSYRYIEWYSRPYGKLIYAAARDITERKQTELHLRKIATHLSTAQRIGKLGSWEFDLVSGAVQWSDEVFQIFGRDSGLGPPSFDELQQLLHPADRDLHYQTIHTAIAQAQPYDIEFRAFCPDGRLVYIQGRGEPILDTRGQVSQFVGTVLDITAAKLAEAKIQRYATQLEASNQELEAFAYSVSHDLRAPLRAIDGFSQALLEDYSDLFNQEARDYFDRIRKNVTRMGLLIENLLSLSRVSRIEIRYTSINLSSLVQELVHDLQASEPGRSIKWVIAPDVVVSTDATLIRVVMVNLLQNAWKFTSHHTTARIEFGVMHQSGEPIYFVRDDGAGFDMAFSNLLFGVFQRLHNVNEFPGTGIGLASVQRAIHRQGGRIWAESAVEQGATFYFTLPGLIFTSGV